MIKNLANPLLHRRARKLDVVRAKRVRASRTVWDIAYSTSSRTIGLSRMVSEAANESASKLVLVVMGF